MIAPILFDEKPLELAAANETNPTSAQYELAGMNIPKLYTYA
jgi:hypothetical protein